MKPYAESAQAYLQAGFSPLPARDKILVVKGFSGYDGRMTTTEDVAKWIREFPTKNVVLRLPDNVIALDVDAYKNNHVLLSKLEDRFGKLPRTWNADARNEGGGKILYRVPRGTKLVQDVAGITVLQHTHRYVLAPPSWHDGVKALVRWRDHLDGPPIIDEIPLVDELPEFPEPWINALHEERVRTYRRPSNPITSLKVFDNGDPCQFMTELQDECERQLIDAYDSGLHDNALNVLGKVFNAGVNGHSGIAQVVDHLGDVFVEARRSRDLTAEWESLVYWVLDKVDIEELVTVDFCKVKLILPNKEPNLSNFDRLRTAGMSVRNARYMVERMRST